MVKPYHPRVSQVAIIVKSPSWEHYPRVSKGGRQSRSSRGRGGAAVATKKQKCSIANIVLKDYMTLR